MHPLAFAMLSCDSRDGFRGFFPMGVCEENVAQKMGVFSLSSTVSKEGETPQPVLPARFRAS
jgi:hypothetical protein